MSQKITVFLFVLALVYACGAHAEADKGAAAIKVSASKLYDNIDIRYFAPADYDTHKDRYPAIYLMVLPGTKHVDEMAYAEFVKAGFLVVQIVKVRRNIVPKMTYKQFYEAVQKDVRLDPKNVFALGFSASGVSAMQACFSEPASFAGVISIGHISPLPKRVTPDMTRLPALVVAGTRDPNYQPIVKSAKAYTDRKMNLTLKTVEGLGHELRKVDMPPILEWCKTHLKK